MAYLLSFIIIALWIFSILLSLLHDYCATTMHELRHAKAIQKCGHDALILIPRKNVHDINVKYKHGIKIFYVNNRYMDDYFTTAMTLSSNNFQSMTDKQIQKVAGAGLFFSVRYAVIQSVCTVLDIIMFIVLVISDAWSWSLYKLLFLGFDSVLIVLFIWCCSMDILGLLCKWYNVTKKNDFSDYNDFAIIKDPEGFREHCNEIYKDEGGIYEFYDRKFSEMAAKSK